MCLVGGAVTTSGLRRSFEEAFARLTDSAMPISKVVVTKNYAGQYTVAARLDRLGIAYQPERHRDSDSIYFADPDGTVLEVMAPRA